MESTAQQVGFVVGAILGIVLMLGVPALFVVSLILAIRKKATGWTVVAVVTGLVSLALLGLFSFGVYTGIMQNRRFVAADQEIPPDRRIVSDDGLCELTIPADWKRLENLHDSATLQVGNVKRGEFMIVLTDLKEDFAGTLAQHVEITTQSLIAALSSAETVGPEELQIDGGPALRYEITGTNDLANVFYVQTTVEGSRGFYQVLGWTLKSRAGAARDTLIETAASFREVEVNGR